MTSYLVRDFIAGSQKYDEGPEGVLLAHTNMAGRNFTSHQRDYSWRRHNLAWEIPVGFFLNYYRKRERGIRLWHYSRLPKMIPYSDYTLLHGSVIHYRLLHLWRK